MSNKLSNQTNQHLEFTLDLSDVLTAKKFAAKKAGPKERLGLLVYRTNEGRLGIAATTGFTLFHKVYPDLEAPDGLDHVIPDEILRVAELLAPAKPSPARGNWKFSITDDIVRMEIGEFVCEAPAIPGFPNFLSLFPERLANAVMLRAGLTEFLKTCLSSKSKTRPSRFWIYENETGKAVLTHTLGGELGDSFVLGEYSVPNFTRPLAFKDEVLRPVLALDPSSLGITRVQKCPTFSFYAGGAALLATPMCEDQIPEWAICENTRKILAEQDKK